MLLDIRKSTRGLIATGILGLLALAFVLFLPSGAVMQAAGISYVAKVGNETVTPNQLARRFDQQLRTMRDQGQQVTRDQAVEANFHQQLLDQLITQRAFWELTRRLGVHASDKQVAELIHQIPGVKDPVTGEFSKDAYERFLAQLGYRIPEFEREVRNDQSTELLLAATTPGVRAPAAYGRAFLAYQSEQRFVTVSEIPLSMAGAIAPPTDEQIQAFYQENADRLKLPEFRDITLVFARNADFAARVNVPEQKIREEFEQRRESLGTPERRSLAQLSAPSEAVARDAAARLARGEAPQAVADALHLQAVRYDDRTRDDVPDAGVAEAAFAMKVGDPARAVPARLSPWAVVELISVTPAVEASFENERETIRNELASVEANNMMDAAVSQFEDARSAGTAIADAARAANLDVVKVESVDAQGRSRTGEPVAALAAAPDLIDTAFATAEGESSDFGPAGDNVLALVAVDRIIPESTRPLEEVRADLTQAWIARERMRRVSSIRDEVINQVKGGQSFQAVLRAHGLRVAVSGQPITRDTANRLPARSLGAEIFNGKVGDVVADIRSDGQSVVLAQIDRVERADPANSAAEIEQGRAQFEQSLTQGMQEVIALAARDAANPRRNESLLSRLYAPSESPDAAKQ